MTEPAIERVGPRCKRCGRVPTAQTDHELLAGYCYVCYDRRREQAVDAALWLVYRGREIEAGRWYDPDETPGETYQMRFE